MYYNHNLRITLQEWKNRLSRSTIDQFGNQLRFCLTSFESNKLISGLLQEAMIKYPYTDDELNEFINGDFGLPEIRFRDESHQASYCYHLLRHIVIRLNNDSPLHSNLFSGSTLSESQTIVIADFVAPILHYLHDSLDKSSSILYLLEKYKRRTEWFTAKELVGRYRSAEKSYEQIFEDDLRLFLFDQGIDYPFSTPKSTSGRSDIVGAIDTEDPLIVEIKIFDKDKGYGKNRIIEGFSQIIKYTNDYNKDVGYLVVFNLDEAELSIELNEKNKFFPPMLSLNSKSYFVISINLSIGRTASRIGKTEVLCIHEDELTRSLTE